MCGRIAFLAMFGFLSPVPGNETVQIVAIRSIRTKVVFVEETLYTAAQANLVGMVLGTDWPAHFAMPATAQNHHRSPC